MFSSQTHTIFLKMHVYNCKNATHSLSLSVCVWTHSFLKKTEIWQNVSSSAVSDLPLCVYWFGSVVYSVSPSSKLTLWSCQTTRHKHFVTSHLKVFGCIWSWSHKHGRLLEGSLPFQATFRLYEDKKLAENKLMCLLADWFLLSIFRWSATSYRQICYAVWTLIMRCRGSLRPRASFSLPVTGIF